MLIGCPLGQPVIWGVAVHGFLLKGDRVGELASSLLPCKKFGLMLDLC